MIRLSESQLRQIMPFAPGDRARALISHQDQLDRFGIRDNSRRFAMWLANVAHECGELRTLVENGNYSVAAIRRTWPGRFKSDAAAALYAHNPEKLFNSTYANRMGNGPPSSGDGFRYRGRGLAMLTGKDAYRKIGDMLGLPLVENPDKVTDPEWMVIVGGAFWHWKSLNALADANNFRAVVSRWNGGYIGLDKRLKYFDRAVAVLAANAGHDVPFPKPTPKPQPAYDIAAAQRKLRDLGYYPGNVDGDAGVLTRDAILSFQADNSLWKTGELDDATWRALSVAGPKYIPEARRNATAGTLREKGSATVSYADKLKAWALWLVGGGSAAVVGDTTSPLETLKEYTDQASYWRYAIEPLQDLWALASAHKLLLVIAAGVAIYFIASRIIATRVEDERSGAHRGR